MVNAQGRNQLPVSENFFLASVTFFIAFTEICIVEITVKIALRYFVPELPNLMIIQGQIFFLLLFVSLIFCLICFDMGNKNE